jgi:hypothetical protein
MLDRADMGTWVLDMILIDVLSYAVKAMPHSEQVCGAFSICSFKCFLNFRQRIHTVDHHRGALLMRLLQAQHQQLM